MNEEVQHMNENRKTRGRISDDYVNDNLLKLPLALNLTC